MCKIKKALAAGDFESLSTMSINANDIEIIIDDAQTALEDDLNLINETTPSTVALQQRIERAQKRVHEARTIIENGNELLEMMEKGEFVDEFAREEY